MPIDNLAVTVNLLAPGVEGYIDAEAQRPDTIRFGGTQIVCAEDS